MNVESTDDEASITDTRRKDVMHSSNANHPSSKTLRYFVGIVVLVLGLVIIICVTVAGGKRQQTWPLRENHTLGVGHRITLSSPGYPHSLPGNNVTYVRRYGTGYTNYVIRFKFTIFKIGGSSFLEMANFNATTNTSSTLAMFREGDWPGVVYSSSNDVLVTFYVSSGDFNPGFSAEVSVYREGAIPPIQCDVTSEWACLDGVRCIPIGARCDNETDCSYGEDEDACDPCGYGHFQCTDGRCIQDYLKCDHRNHCPEGDDEWGCNMPGPCPSTHFTCSDTTCIPRNQMCDSNRNCGDLSDESEETCGECNPIREFACDDGMCVPHHRRCNGFADCYNSDDERNCSDFYETYTEYIELEPDNPINITSSNWPTGRPQAMAVWEVRAPEGYFVRIDFLSFDFLDLSTLSIYDTFNVTDVDEKRIYLCYRSCAGDYVRSFSNEVSLHFHVRAFSGSPGFAVSVIALPPEDIRLPTCNHDDFSCKASERTENQTCLRKWQLCDNYENCADGEDERNCTDTPTEWWRNKEYACQSSNVSLWTNQLCDYFAECPLLDDEMDCVCKDTDFTCNSGMCVSFYQICNFYYDCAGGMEDEQHCSSSGNTFHYRLDPFRAVNIASPVHPPAYGSRIYTEYHIVTFPDHVISVFFDFFEIDAEMGLAFIDGDDGTNRSAMFALFEYKDKPAIIYSKSNVMTLNFYGGIYALRSVFRLELHAVEIK